MKNRLNCEKTLTKNLAKFTIKQFNSATLFCFRGKSKNDIVTPFDIFCWQTGNKMRQNAENVNKDNENQSNVQKTLDFVQGRNKIQKKLV